MLVIKKELDFHDFLNDFSGVTEGLDYEACELIFNSLEDFAYNSNGIDEMTVKDYIRFQVQIQAQNEVLSNYNIIHDEEYQDMDEDDIHEAIENYLSYNTNYLGSYEDINGVKIYVFDEF